MTPLNKGRQWKDIFIYNGERNHVQDENTSALLAMCRNMQNTFIHFNCKHCTPSKPCEYHIKYKKNKILHKTTENEKPLPPLQVTCIISDVLLLFFKIIVL